MAEAAESHEDQHDHIREITRSRDFVR